MLNSEHQKVLDNNSPFDINTEDYYFTKMRPHLKKMLDKCKTDGELIRTIDKVINASDTLCMAKKHNELSEAYYVLYAAITDKNYFNGVMSKAPEQEKELVRDLIEKIDNFQVIIKFENKPNEKKEYIKDRLNYSNSDSLKENLDFGTHNMKVLNTPKPKSRIPNV